MRFLLVLLSMVAVSTLDSEDPLTKQTAWVLFMASALLSTIVFSLATFIVGRKKDQTEIEVLVDNPSNGMLGKALKIEGSDAAPEYKKMTVQQYDSDKLREFSFQRTVVPSMIIMFMHYKYGSVIPLVLQAVNSLVSLWSFELIQIHIMNKPAVGALKRPFVATGLMAMISGQSPAAAAAPAGGKKKKH